MAAFRRVAIAFDSYTLRTVGPIFFAAQLVANLVIFWIVLGLENFTKEMRIGTYVIVIAVTLLLRVGPGTQDNQDFATLIMKPYSLVWSGILMAIMCYTAFFVLFVDMMKYGTWTRIIILLASRASAFALNLSAGRALILKAGSTWIILTTVIKILSGGIYTKAIVVQSTAVDQNVFVPLNAAAIIITNAITGVIIWEDWRVVRDWTGYTCVFLLLIMGCNLLLGDLQLLNEINPKAFKTRYAWVRTEGRRQLFDNLNNIRADDGEDFFDDQDDENDVKEQAEGDVEESRSADCADPSEHGEEESVASLALSRTVASKEAWLNVYGIKTENGTRMLRQNSMVPRRSSMAPRRMTYTTPRRMTSIPATTGDRPQSIGPFNPGRNHRRSLPPTFAMNVPGSGTISEGSSESQKT